MEKKQEKTIPDIELIDLDEDSNFSAEASAPAEENSQAPDSDIETTFDTDNNSGDIPKKKGFRLNTHIILLAVVLIVIFAIVFRFKNWGQFISQEEIRNNIEGTYKSELDLILPLTDEEGKIVPLNTKDGLSIVFFGNSPLADDRDSEDNLVNMIADMTGATVYNCSVGSSYLAAERSYFIPQDRPLDAYTFYWLACKATGLGNDEMYIQAKEYLGDDIPEDVEATLSTLDSIDFNTVDVIAVMYDAYDYLIGHPMYSDQNPTDITQFTGNLEAGIEILQTTYPHIRIIVMSPTYAFSNETDENGEYISSDIIRYGRDVLSTYVIKEYASCASRQVTFIDNLYGTVTEDNAKDYLIDNRHLNVAGRKEVAERFVYALNFYNGN